ncbi:HRDC domain-containing protein [Arenibaculum pallidiluteum]|uniref:HRDC domain-containing protein n=1 Tax=Arenibaculum pallidiluteum TaxID=2812559 RepID=UPI001A97579F|nr:HRDC domain-containing protein [Arenibaculum pallidiluteum]
MKGEVRTFKIRDSATQEDEEHLAGFLRTVEVKRIETAYAEGAWHILVVFEDLRRREESAQIRSAILESLSNWRNRTAQDMGFARDALMPDAALQEIARYAPTTEVELSVIAGSLGLNLAEHGAALVQVVRQTLEDLTAVD